MLQNFAATHNVKMVVVSIGGNDFNFGSIVQTCVEDFLGSPSWWPDYCNDDSSVTSNFTSSNINTVKSHIATAYQNLRTAMRNAGYSDGSWTLLVQNYPSPIPNASGFRYSQSGYTRQSTGGCGFWNADADWANSTALPDDQQHRRRRDLALGTDERQHPQSGLDASTGGGCARPGSGSTRRSDSRRGPRARP